MLELLKNKWAQLALASLVALFLGFAAGHSTRKEPEVRVEEKIVEKTVVDEKAVEIAVEKAKAEWSKNQKEKVVTRIVTKADGERVEETVRETETAESKKEEQTKQQEKIVTKTETVTKEVQTKIEIIPYKPQWSLGVEVHKDIPSIKESKLTENVDYSVSVGRHMAWNIWLEGSYKMKSKEAGLGIRYEF